MNVCRASHVIGRHEMNDRCGKVGLVHIRADVDRPCFLVPYPDGQEHAVLFEDISAGISTRSS